MFAFGAAFGFYGGACPPGELCPVVPYFKASTRTGPSCREKKLDIRTPYAYYTHMKRSLYIPEDIWQKLGILSSRLGLRSKSNVICHLVTIYTLPTHMKITGETLFPPGNLNVGRQGDVVDVEGVARVGEYGDDPARFSDEPGEVEPESFRGVRKRQVPKPDVAKVVESEDAVAKAKAIESIKSDLNAIMGRGVRSYSKEQQLGKDRKK